MSEQENASRVQKGTKKSPLPLPEETCLWGGEMDHSVKDCRSINSKCQFHQKKGKESVGYNIEEKPIQMGKESVGYII